VAPHFAFGSYEALSEGLWPVRPRGAFYGPFRGALPPKGASCEQEVRFGEVALTDGLGYQQFGR
jgi:hypothetical protein